MTPQDEAAEILIRLFNALAAGMGKRLKEEHKSEIRRGACAGTRSLTCAPGRSTTAMVRRAKGRANGEGSIYQEGAGWFAQITLADGKHKRKRARTKAEALEKLDELRQLLY